MRDWIPGWARLRALRRQDIPRELAAGLSIAAVAAPVGLAIATLIGMPPVCGLYASIFPVIAYALFGPSNYLVVGPDTATGLLVAAALTSLGWTELGDKVVGASILALISGVGFGLASVAKLGFIANLLSRPILVGYMGGVAITLLASQVTNFTGLLLVSEGLFPRVVEAITRAPDIHLLTLALGLSFFAAIRILKRFAPALPATAIIVVVAIIASWIFDLDSHGVAVVGPIPSGLPLPAFPDLRGHFADFGLSALGLMLLSFISGVVTAQGFGQKLGVTSDPNLELRGFAAANIAASLFQTFPVTGGDSRTAANISSGGRTPLAPMASAVILAVVVAVVTAPLSLLPLSALGAILASAAIGLIDFRAFAHLARIGSQELIFALVAMAGVVWVGVLQGIFLAISATLIHMLAISARPRHAVLGAMEGRPDLVSMDRHPLAAPPKDGVVFSFWAALYFMNADYFRERALAALHQTPEAKWFVLDASSIPFVDSTGLGVLIGFRQTLEVRGIHFAIARANGRFREILERADATSWLSAREFHSTPNRAIAAMRAIVLPT